MNKALFQKVKDLTKDSGVSEKYLKSITEKMGGAIEDDSTDTEAIEECANLIAGVVADTQAEATRWAQKNKGGKKSKKSSKADEEEDDDEDDDDSEEDDDDTEKGGKGSKKAKKSKSDDDRFKALEDALAQLKAERAGSERKSEIDRLMEKHKIPEYLRNRLAKSIGEDEDADEVISEYKQQLITSGLSEDNEGAKGGASSKDVDSAAEDNLKAIEAK